MKQIAAILLAASLLLLFGCPSLDSGGAAQGGGVKVKPISKQEPAPVQNNTVPGNASAPAANETLPEVEENGTDYPEEGRQEEPERQVPIIKTPRNVSENIADGDFGLVELPLEPLRVTVIDCGNAYCILVQKGAFYMLVDAGDEEAVRAELQRQGVESIAVVVATRDDPGAIAGLAGIIDSYPVQEFWYNGIAGKSEAHKALLAKVANMGIAVKKPRAKDRMNVSGLEVIALNPQKVMLRGNPESDAIVLKLSSEGFCMLLLNPTLHEMENAIIGTGVPLACPAITYFNHGEGRPVPSVLVRSYAMPKDAIISVGENDFSLPSATTLERLASQDAAAWRTDANGSIYVETMLLGGYRIGVMNATSGETTWAER